MNGDSAVEKISWGEHCFARLHSPTAHARTEINRTSSRRQ